MTRCKLHIVYEYGLDLRPHASAFVRLLRPLTHPASRVHFDASVCSDFQGERVDGVVVDRLWRPDVTMELARRLIGDIRRADARFIYAIDDDLIALQPRRLDLVSNASEWPTREHKEIVAYFLRQADAVVVTTPFLKQSFSTYNANIHVIPNVLDERLLSHRPGKEPRHASRSRRVIGYMGTLTHDDDLRLVLPVIKVIAQRYADVDFQIIGGVGQTATLSSLIDDLPVHFVNPDPRDTEYPLFMLWFLKSMQWDIAIAPLLDTQFSRGKSDLKFLDYSALRTAGIYSRVPAYVDTVRALHTGLLVDNTPECWLDAVELLLSDVNLRDTLSENAWHHVISHRIPQRIVPLWRAVMCPRAPDSPV